MIDRLGDCVRVLVMIILIFIGFDLQSKTILVVDSYTESYQWSHDYRQALKESLDKSYHWIFFEMNTKVLPSHEHPAMAKKAFDYYLKIKPDLVVLGDDNALTYLVPLLYEESIDIVFLGINDNPRNIKELNQGLARITGVLERPLYIKNIASIGRFFINPKILVLFDDSYTSQITLNYLYSNKFFVKEKLNIEVEYLSVISQQEWQKSILNAHKNGFDAIIVGLYQSLIDASEENVSDEEIIQWTAKNSPVPIFAFWDFSVGENKAMGGIVLSGKNQGEIAASLIKQIVEQGKNPRMIPFELDRKGTTLFIDGQFKK